LRVCLFVWQYCCVEIDEIKHKKRKKTKINQSYSLLMCFVKKFCNWLLFSFLFFFSFSFLLTFGWVGSVLRLILKKANTEAIVTLLHKVGALAVSDLVNRIEAELLRNGKAHLVA